MKRIENLRTSEMLLLIIAVLLLLIMVYIANKIPGAPGLAIDLFLIIIFYATFHLSRFIGITTPVRLDEGQIYIFFSADEKKGWLFLEKHVHTDEYTALHNPNPDFATPITMMPIKIPAEDYDLPENHYGQVFDPAIKKGDFVVAVNQHGKMGIILKDKVA